jgi:hypothetical protein
VERKAMGYFLLQVKHLFKSILAADKKSGSFFRNFFFQLKAFLYAFLLYIERQKLGKERIS